jgi:hypothetical protein
MRKPELSGLKGEFEVKLYGPDGILKDYRKVKNMTVTTGFQNVCDLMGKETATSYGFQHCAIGTGLDAPALADTILGTELARVAGGYTRTADTVWTNNATFGAGTGTGAITESGMFNGASVAYSNTLLCRQTFAVINKGASDTLVVTWQYTLS